MLKRHPAHPFTVGLHGCFRYRPQRPSLPLALGRVGRPNWPPCAGIAMSSTSEASADGYSDQRRDDSAAPDDTVHVRRTETLCRWVALKAAAREGAASWCHTA